MNWNAQTILATIGIILAVGGIIKPQWPLVAIAVLLACIAILLIGK